MKKLSIRKFSVYGIALMSASAIVALVLPTKAKQKPASDEGMLVGNLVNTTDGLTCITFVDGTGTELLCTKTTKGLLGDSSTTINDVKTAHTNIIGNADDSFADGNTTLP